MNGYYGDSAYTYPVGEVSAKKRKLLRVTKESLYKGLENAIVGKRLGDISYAIQYHAQNFGFSVVREMVGHGVGKRLHEPPEIPNYGRKRTGILLEEGMVFAIEPMINMGKKGIKFLDDGWTIVTTDGHPSAHFEHTVAIRNNKVEILSSFDFIEEN
jgi:methionyl aminopeptidase